ncbi:serine hydrolase domain-containing protein [Salarchaeum sp. III]|uniref:serine hydrolase domain-containing protein n=1 Tax=Salarchaeum sp. III TaxID=3107927 RepID=UPI002EDADD3D
MSVFDADGPTRIEQLFAAQLDAGLHHGAQLAVYDGEDRVLSLAGGETGPDGDPVTPDRKFVLFSCTKPYTAACVHHLVDEGDLAYDDSLTDYWPEYADEGSEKAKTTVADVLTHRAGLALTDLDRQPDTWTDWDASVRILEDATPRNLGDPAYHPVSFGFLAGELVRRVSGDSVGTYARDHVFDPIEMEHTHIGLPETEPDDVATLTGFDDPDRCRTPPTGLGLDRSDSAATFNRDPIHRAEIPAAGGVGTAADMARFYACLANGGRIGDDRILDTDTVATLTRVHAQTERDPTLSVPRRYGLGVVRAGTAHDKYGTLAPDRVFGHGGLGSSVAWADPGTGIAFAYVTNGIRDPIEHRARVNELADAVRTVYA